MWLLESSVKQAIEQAQAAGVMPNAEQQALFQARAFDAGSTNGTRILTTSGDTATIDIIGVLTQAPSFLAMLFGGGNTTYSEIAGAVAAAEQDPNINNIDYNIDSPGGEFDGLFNTIDIINAAQKPSKAIVKNMAASAAYALAAQADKIEASNKASRVGNVGVVASFELDKNKVEIASTQAPKKRPDLSTEEGKAVVREQLDPMHDLFANAIADGRNTTADKVNADFGQGATLLAEDALKRGMIDSISNSGTIEITKVTNSDDVGKKLEANNMDLKELKAKHPDVFAEAAKEGADTERDRVTAHLTMGESSGDMKTALEAIKDGSLMTQTLQASYMAAGMNRSDLAGRQDDDAGAGDAADGASLDDNQDGAGDAVASAVESKLGLEV